MFALLPKIFYFRRCVAIWLTPLMATPDLAQIPPNQGTVYVFDSARGNS